KPEPGTSNARLLAGEDVVHMPDITDDAGVSENSLVRRALIEIGGFRTILSIALRREGSLLGIIHIYCQEVRPFTDTQIAMFFNDPMPIPDPAERAVNMAVSMREAAGVLIGSWRRRGRELGFGAGIAQGYATLGQIGFAERSGYTAIGTVCNLAARLCAEAKDGQILIAQRVAVAVDQAITLEEIGSLSLKGLTQPVVAYNVPVVGNQAAF